MVCSITYQIKSNKTVYSPITESYLNRFSSSITQIVIFLLLFSIVTLISIFCISAYQCCSVLLSVNVNIYFHVSCLFSISSCCFLMICLKCLSPKAKQRARRASCDLIVQCKNTFSLRI